jgi:hypothetical protein
MITATAFSEIPFTLRYLNACSNYEMKNTRDALSQLYGILRDLEKQIPLPNVSAAGLPTNEDDAKSKANYMIKKEMQELFGLFPPKSDIDAKVIMTTFEITRIHQRQ